MYPFTNSINGVLQVTDNLTVQEYPDGLLFIGGADIDFCDILSIPDNMLIYVSKKVGNNFSRMMAEHILSNGTYQITF